MKFYFIISEQSGFGIARIYWIAGAIMKLLTSELSTGYQMNRTLAA